MNVSHLVSSKPNGDASLLSIAWHNELLLLHAQVDLVTHPLFFSSVVNNQHTQIVYTSTYVVHEWKRVR